MTMTTLTEQIALQEASWNHVTPLERLCQKFFAILTRPHLRRHHLHLTTILPLCHTHQNSTDVIIKAILITILAAPGRLSLTAETCQRTTLTQLSVTSNHFLQLQAFVFHTFVCLSNVHFCHCLCLFPETPSCFQDVN